MSASHVANRKFQTLRLSEKQQNVTGEENGLTAVLFTNKCLSLSRPSQT